MHISLCCVVAPCVSCVAFSSLPQSSNPPRCVPAFLLERQTSSVGSVCSRVTFPHAAAAAITTCARTVSSEMGTGVLPGANATWAARVTGSAIRLCSAEAETEVTGCVVGPVSLPLLHSTVASSEGVEGSSRLVVSAPALALVLLSAACCWSSSSCRSLSSCCRSCRMRGSTC